MDKPKLYQGEYDITSPFGPRTLENGDKRPHKGIDCVGRDNKYIVVPTNGKIVSSQIITNKANPTWEWGNYVKMDDLNGYYLFFCHLNKRLVTAGQIVKKGQVIGVEGQTGYSFGSHLHFEVRRKSDNVSIDPLQYQKILADWEAKHLQLLMTSTQKRFGFDDATMNFLKTHPYPSALFDKLANMK
jgi:murein DD-endopeptidase MepM/ murein hydrolase activator NlpD